MKVSVIIPCFNQGHFLRDCIDSVLRQVNSNFELILVDDGSTDETAAVAKSYGDRITYIHQNNSGLSSARNTGIRQATGDLLHFLDADDYISANLYEKATETFIVNPAADIVYAGYIKVDAYSRFISIHDVQLEPQDPYHYLLSENRWPCHAIIVRRQVVSAAGWFNERLKALEDWDMWLRVASKGGRFIPIRNEYAYYRQYEYSMSKNRDVMFWASLEVLSRARRHHSNCCYCKILSAKTIEAVIAYYFLPEMTQYLKQAHLFHWAKRLSKVFLQFPEAAIVYLSLLYSQLKRGFKTFDKHLTN